MAASRPHVILSAAVSVDGKIATKAGYSNLSSKKDKARLHQVRSKVDAILVGKNTVRVDDPLLTVRYAKGKNPIRVVVDSRAEISPRSKILKTSGKVPTIIAVSESAPKKNLTRLSKHPVKVMTVGKNKVDIKKLLIMLKNQKIRTLLAEGGGTLNWELVRLGLVDEMIITITPYLVGGKEAITMLEGEGFSKITSRLKLDKVMRQENEVVLYYS